MAADETQFLSTMGLLAEDFRTRGIKVNYPDEEPCRTCDRPDTMSAWIPQEGKIEILFQYCPVGHTNLIN